MGNRKIYKEDKRIEEDRGTKGTVEGYKGLVEGSQMDVTEGIKKKYREVERDNKSIKDAGGSAE